MDNNNTIPTWECEGEALVFQFRTYRQEGRTAVEALNRVRNEGDGSEAWESYTMISVNMTDESALPQGQFFLKHWSENAEIVAAMIAQGLIVAVDPPVTAGSGFVTTRAYQFTELGMRYCITENA